MLPDEVDKVNKQGTVSPDEIVEALHAVVHAARGGMHEALRGQGLELSPLEARLMGFFGRHPGATLRDLVEHSGRDKGQLARLVGALRERGLLVAQDDPDDRRVTRLHLSEAAQHVHQGVRRQRQKLARQALDGIDETQRVALLALLQQMRRNLG